MSYYNYGYSNSYGVAEAVSSLIGGILAFVGIFMLVLLVISIFMIVSNWKLYKKAGKIGWESIVPIYNIIVLLEIAGLPLWYIALFFVPFANIYAMFKIYIELAHKFGQSTGFGVAMVFFPVICIPILAFGKSSYIGNISNEPINNGYNPNQPVNPLPVYGYDNQPSQNVEQPQVSMNEPQQNNTFMFNNTVEQVEPQPQQPASKPVDIFNGQIPVTQNQTSETVQPVTQAEPTLNSSMPNVTDIPQQSVNQVKYCPNCGNKTALTADTCFMCGHKF